jgi:hypothetical protein
MANRRFAPRKASGRGLIWLMAALLALALAGLGLEHGRGGPVPTSGVLSARQSEGGGTSASTGGSTTGGGVVGEAEVQSNKAGGGGDDAHHSDNDCDQLGDNGGTYPSCLSGGGPGVSGSHKHVKVCHPNLSANPNRVQAGATTQITITGDCHNDTFTVSLYDGSDTSTTIQTGPDGMGQGTLPVGPGTTNGQHTVSAVDSDGNFGSTQITTFGGPTQAPKVCHPSLSAHPGSARAGQTITLQISGDCPSGDTFSITFGNPNTPEGTITIQANHQGQGPVTIPAGAAKGQHTVSAVDSEGNAGSVTVNVK